MPTDTINLPSLPSAAALRALVTDATYELRYWQRQAVTRTNPRGIAQAKQRAANWTAILAQREADLRATQP